jgi:DNA-binding SARP family transcriptional activator/predicted ATPase
MNDAIQIPAADLPGLNRHTLFQACLLGTLTLSQANVVLVLPPTSEARSLLAYLLLWPHQSHPRVELIGRLWPDRPETQGRRAVSRALWRIRHILPPDSICTDSYAVCFAPTTSLWVDVAAFESLIAPHLHSTGTSETAVRDLRRAIELYRGDLLADFYEDWTQDERERLREMYLQALERLLRQETAAGRYEQALGLAQTLTRVDPLREAAHRAVMRLYTILQRPEAALKQFATCRQLLSAELDLEPEAETIALAHEIASHVGQGPVVVRQEPAGMPHTQVPLIGRNSERTELLRHMEAIFHGAGGIVLVEGEAGVGKTRLLQEMARSAAWRGAQVLWGHAKEETAASPYECLAEALTSELSALRAAQLAQVVQKVWLQVLSRLLPALRLWLPQLEPPAGLAPAEERERLIEAFVQCLVGWSQIAPLVVILEDLHWADADTLDVLPQLARRLLSSGVLVLATLRGGEARARPETWARLQELDQAGLIGRLLVRPLTPKETGELIRQSLGLSDPAPVFEGELYRETGGNPLFLLETLRTLYDEGLLFPDVDGEWSTPFDDTTTDYAELPLSPVVERTILRRLALLSPPLRQTLNAAAVVGSRIGFTLLSVISGLEPRALMAAAGELVRQRLLEETPQGYCFTHDKLRQVVYASLDSDRRLELHRLAAHALESAPLQEIEALVQHYTQGQVWDQAVCWHLRAAEQSKANYAVESALAHYTGALRVLATYTPFDPPRAAEIRFEVCAARWSLLYARGELAQAAADLDEMGLLAETLGVPERQAEALNQKAAFLCQAGDFEQARQVAEAALALAQQNQMSRQAAVAFEQLGNIYQESQRHAQAEAALTEALTLWQTLEGTRLQVAQVHCRRALGHYYQGQTAEAEAECRAALAIAQDADDPAFLELVYGILATLAAERGDYRTRIGYNQANLEKMQALGLRRKEAALLSNLGMDYWILCDYRPATLFMQQALEIYRELDDRLGKVLSLNTLGGLYREIGRLDESRVMLREGLEQVDSIERPFVKVLLLSELGRLELDQHHTDAALQALHAAYELAATLSLPFPRGYACFGLGLAALASGNVSVATGWFERALEACQVAREHGYTAAARSYLALCHLLSDDKPEALRLSTQAVAEIEATSAGEELQTIYWHHWRILRAAGQSGAAQAALERAYATIQSQQVTLPDRGWQQDFVEHVPVNRDIAAACAAARTGLPAGRVAARLPRAGAPTGRPLRADEWIDVTWNASLPEDESIPEAAERRRARLLRLVREATGQGAAPTVEDLAEALHVATKTIKRDLTALRQAGHQIVTRGSRPCAAPPKP